MRPIHHHGHLNRNGRKLKKMLVKRTQTSLTEPASSFFGDAQRQLRDGFISLRLGEVKLGAVLGNAGVGMGFNSAIVASQLRH